MVMHYEVKRVTARVAKEYIKAHHYSKGCHNGPSPCYGLYASDPQELIGVLMFATPCSENVRASVFGSAYKGAVVELHRLHIKDVTPKNTESWFISRCLKQLVLDRPATRGVLSFSDLTEGHAGTIYKACNAHRIGSTGHATFYKDPSGRLRHPRQNGVNITAAAAAALGWVPERRRAKNRYLWVVGPSVGERKKFERLCKLLKGNRNEV